MNINTIVVMLESNTLDSISNSDYIADKCNEIIQTEEFFINKKMTGDQIKDLIKELNYDIQEQLANTILFNAKEAGMIINQIEILNKHVDASKEATKHMGEFIISFVLTLCLVTSIVTVGLYYLNVKAHKDPIDTEITKFFVSTLDSIATETKQNAIEKEQEEMLDELEP